MRTPPPEFTNSLAGLRVSRPWKGYGSAIFLELGELIEVRGLRRGSVTGQACISVEWDWRLEHGSVIIGGSSDAGPTINACLKALRDAVVTEIEIEGQVPEIVVRFSTGHVLRSMAMIRGDPQWHIRVQKDRWLYVKDGGLFVGTGIENTSEPESEAFAVAESTASRWGVPISEPKLGECKDCRFFVALDGTGHLLDYGCCTSERSPLDGRAVYHTSGCSAFSVPSEA
jgi:hypothetical protein